MLLAKSLERPKEIVFCLLAFFLPFPYIFAPPLIVCLVILWLITLKPGQLYHNFKERKVLWIWLAYFFLFAISYTYSYNKKQSLFDLQSKLCFIIMPLVIGAGGPILKKMLERILFYFSIGVTCIALFCMIRSYIIWHQTHYTLILFYNNLTKGFDQNAVYEALYAIFSIISLLVFPWEDHFKKNKIFKILLVLIQLSFFILLSSRTLLVLFFLIIIPVFIRQAHKINKLVTLSILFSLAAFLFFLFTTQNPIKHRYMEIVHTENGKIEMRHDTTIYNFNNLTLRLFLWKTGIGNIRKHNLWWIGAGNGDAQDIQNKKFSEYSAVDTNIVNPLLNLNMHNMYLQSLIMVGIPGLILFIMLVFSPFLYIKYNELGSLILIFNLIACIFMIQESSFQTQAGIIYYSFFSMLFWNYYYSKKDDAKKVQNAR